jgi:hypothetical protein
MSEEDVTIMVDILSVNVEELNIFLLIFEED